MCGNIIFRVPLTNHKITLFSKYFSNLDKVNNTGELNIIQVQPFFLSTGLSKNIINAIWEIIDVNQKKTLKFKEFSTFLRAIAYLQQHPNYPITSDLYQFPCSTVLFPGSQGSFTKNSNSITIDAANIPATSPNQADKSKILPIPVLSKNDL